MGGRRIGELQALIQAWLSGLPDKLEDMEYTLELVRASDDIPMKNLEKRENEEGGSSDSETLRKRVKLRGG